MKEIWKDINGFEGKYQISNFGAVKSLSRKVKYNHSIMGYVEANNPEVILNQYLSVGYLKVDLYDNLKRKRKFIHRLIAEAFIPTVSGKKYINHKNNIRTDNRIENLEWCTQSENMVHYFRTIKKSA